MHWYLLQIYVSLGEFKKIIGKKDLDLFCYSVPKLNPIGSSDFFNVKMAQHLGQNMAHLDHFYCIWHKFDMNGQQNQ